MSISIILLNAFPDKKIKSLGNKYLLKINSDEYLIDYKIKLLKQLFHNPEIILVGGFDSKKLQKYITKYYNNIIYISHDFDSKYNIGKSILHGVNKMSGDSCLLLNSSIILNKEIKNILDASSSGVLIQKTNKSNQIGCIINNNKVINCYYGLNNQLYDALYINKEDILVFKKIIDNAINIEKLFLFEIINLCIDNKIDIKPNFITKKSIHTIDSNLQIKNLKNV